MQVTITVHGDPDTLPYTRRFDFQGRDDEVLAASCKRITDMLEAGQRININETLLLLAASVMSSASSMPPAGGRARDADAGRHMPLLSADQVMIGVPEMLQRLDFEVRVGGRRFVTHMDRPIPPDGATVPV